MKLKSLLLLLSFLLVTTSFTDEQPCSHCIGRGWVVCRNCSGKGGFICSTCMGYRVVLVNVWNPYYGMYTPVQQLCSACSGSGVFVCTVCSGKGALTCSNCSGTGTVTSISSKGVHGDATPPSHSSDGYIYQGRSVKHENGLYYKLYKKSGNYYIYDKSDGWIKVTLH